MLIFEVSSQSTREFFKARVAEARESLKGHGQRHARFLKYQVGGVWGLLRRRGAHGYHAVATPHPKKYKAGPLIGQIINI